MICKTCHTNSKRGPTWTGEEFLLGVEALSAATLDPREAVPFGARGLPSTPKGAAKIAETEDGKQRRKLRWNIGLHKTPYG